MATKMAVRHQTSNFYGPPICTHKPPSPMMQPPPPYNPHLDTPNVMPPPPQHWFAPPPPRLALP